ncbi:MAG: alpha/beta hydrolase [Ilumatobacter sp.]|uniref:serine aminopeptidase domain-containing protein n=1 Tax=Ilumatobacter sp. TaxID=1967498 RepID=UPI00262EA07B|nr:alpha/beta hydrolase [Ilumatobacter sp.]MDJ0770525.1 alpha/beta hydrolase [Ilumatobacter sp.]
MSAHQSSFVSSADGTDVATYAWSDVGGEPRGAVQIAHGLAEHAARYSRFAAALNAAGFLAFATDHRGHGRTGADQLGDFGSAGFDGLIADVAEYGHAIAADHAALPLFLFGHSMGSFALQSIIVDRSDAYAGVVLSGSTALDVLAEGLAQSEGPAGLEAFNAGFEHRTGYEWLSRDEAEVDAYVADPWCGFDVPDETIPSLFAPAGRLADPAVLAGIRDDLPILVASGSDDPLAGGGQLVELLGQRYRDAGVTDVTVTVYPGARHEILNETNRDDVTADIVDWLSRHATR